MQQVVIITPVTEPHKLAVLFKSLDHDVPILLHWFVIFDCTQINHYHTWQKVFSFHQEDNINIHCILSDKYGVGFGHNRINVGFDILENDVLVNDPSKAECWVYQLDGNTELHPSFLPYLHENEKAIADAQAIIFHNDLHLPPQTLNMGSFCFRLKILNGRRYSGYNWGNEMLFIQTLVESAEKRKFITDFSFEKVSL